MPMQLMKCDELSRRADITAVTSLDESLSSPDEVALAKARHHAGELHGDGSGLRRERIAPPHVTTCAGVS